MVCHEQDDEKRLLKELNFDVDKVLNPSFSVSTLNVPEDILTRERNFLALNTVQLKETWIIDKQFVKILDNILLNVLKLRFQSEYKTYTKQTGALSGLRVLVQREMSSKYRITCFANNEGQLKLVRCGLEKYLILSSCQK